MKLPVAIAIAALVFVSGAAVADDSSAPTVVPSISAQTPASPATPAVAPATDVHTPAATATPASAAVGKMAADANEDTICETVAPLTGTRLGGGKECHARKWWATRQHDAEQITSHHEMGSWVPPGAGK
ncbi:MAG TPA: hypothetical protein VKR31_08810 [Rhizomicrobium sp.]|nr:hypothetical protein [Rhizomicrobium sp.]